MALDRAGKAEIVSKMQKRFGLAETDTGASEVQIAILTARVNYLTEHFKTHDHNHHSRRGLLILVGKRRRLLDYVKRHDVGRYLAVIQELGLRK